MTPPAPPLAPPPAPAPLRWWNHAWRLLLAAVISGGAAFSTYVEPLGTVSWDPPSNAKLALDVTLGLLSFGLVLLRRRAPLTITVLLTIFSGVSTLSGGAALLATTSLATRRRIPELIGVAVLALVTGEILRWWLPTPDDFSWWATALLVALITSAAMGWGLYIGSRRELLASFRERAVRAEAENELRANKARGDERARIAREMHDVLAHKLSQVSMLSGALAFREGLSPAQVHESAELIQQKANEALADLRGVLGVLRDPASGELLHRPQPTAADVEDLIEESRGAGMRIGWSPSDPVRELLLVLPADVGRTLYRGLQEGLTNAHKHAPGSTVQVEVTAAEGRIAWAVRNPLGFTRLPTDPAAVPGSGLGLIGLAERFEAAGGGVAGRRVGELFVLEGWLPWTR